jgi:hypothetical protein
LGIVQKRQDRDVSLDLGHDPARFQFEQLTSLIAMYTVAVGELAETQDPAVAELLRELVTLRAAMIAALTRVGPSELAR